MTQAQQAIYAFTVGGNTARSKTGQHAVEIDWNSLPDASQDFIVRYGLKQYLADGMAGATSEAEAKSGIDARLKKLAEADFARTRGEGKAAVDTEAGRALKLARDFLRAKLKAEGKTVAKEVVAEAAGLLVEKQPKWKAEAKKQLAAEAKAKEALAEDDGESDILAMLGLGQDEEEAETEEEDEPADDE